MEEARREPSNRDSSSQSPFFFETYFHEVMNLRRFLAFAWYGVERTTDHADFEERVVFPLLARYTGKEAEAFALFLPPADVKAFIKEQKSSEFPFLHQVAVVRLWSILEVAVDDAVLHVLNRTPSLQLPAAVRTIKAPIFEYLAADKDGQNQFLLDCLKQDTRASLKIGVGKFECLLVAVGYGGPVDDEVKRVLLELSEVRNLIVHRAARVDVRFLERCPWFALAKGAQLCVNRSDFSRYLNAVDWYAFELLGRLLGTIDFTTPDAALERHRSTLAQRKENIVQALKTSQSDPSPAS